MARPAELDPIIAEEIRECGKDCDFQTMLGGTLCTDDFYEGLIACACTHTLFFYVTRTSSYGWCHL